VSGCLLSAGELGEQRARAALLRPAVLGVSSSPGALSVSFSPDVDSEVLATLIAVERECCSFLAIDYDERERVLRIGGDDPSVLDGLASFFAAEAVR
jgi:hypothetical protein